MATNTEHQNNNYDIISWFHRVAERLGQGEKPDDVDGPLGTHDVIYYTDDDGRDYALIVFTVPWFVYGEVAYDTFDTFMGFRIYIEDAKLLVKQANASGGE